MIDAYVVCLYQPSIKKRIERQKQLLNDVSVAIIDAANNDKDSVYFSFDAIDKDYLFAELLEYHYTFNVIYESQSPNPHHDIKIEIQWRLTNGWKVISNDANTTT